MGSFTKLVRFKADDGTVYFADLGELASEAPAPRSEITAYKTFEDLLSKSNGMIEKVKEVRRTAGGDGSSRVTKK